MLYFTSAIIFASIMTNPRIVIDITGNDKVIVVQLLVY